MKNKIEFVDFLKGYSILSIVIFHFFQLGHPSPMLAKLISFGGTGIHTFLFASGFGLYLSYLKKPLPYFDFIKKRFSKIYIPYIIVVTVSAIINLFIPIYLIHKYAINSGWYAFFGHVFLYKMFDYRITGSYGYQLWYVSTIIQFYLVFPLLAKLKQKMKGFSLVWISLIISITWSAFVALVLHKETIRSYNSLLLQYLWEFVLGMYCAEKFFSGGYQFWNIKKINLVLMIVIGLGLYALLALKLGTIGQIVNDIPALFGYGALCMLLYGFCIKWINSFILFTANISYSIFLIHFLVINLLFYAATKFNLNWNVLWLLPVLLICYAIAVPLEKFFNRITSALLKKQEPTQKNLA